MAFAHDPLVSSLTSSAASARPAVTRLHERFGVVAEVGFQALPDVLLLHQAELGLTSEELNVLLNLLAHWHQATRMPFPRPATIARRMGVSERTAQRVLKGLIDKGFVARTKSFSATGVPAYDVSLTVEKLRPFAEKRRATRMGTPALGSVAQ